MAIQQYLLQSYSLVENEIINEVVVWFFFCLFLVISSTRVYHLHSCIEYLSDNQASIAETGESIRTALPLTALATASLNLWWFSQVDGYGFVYGFGKNTSVRITAAVVILRGACSPGVRSRPSIHCCTLILSLGYTNGTSIRAPFILRVRVR